MDSSRKITINIIYTGKLLNYTKTSHACIVVEPKTTIGELLSCLSDLYSKEIEEELYIQGTDKISYIVLVSGKIRNMNYILNDDDEVCFISPLCGG